MIEQAIGAVARLAEEARGVKVIRAEAEPADVYYLLHNGRCERVQALPARRSHEVRDLGGLADCVTRLAAGRCATVWVGRDGVAALADDGDRRDRVALPLAASPQMRLLGEWSGQPKWLDQAAAVRALRNVFARSVEGTAAVELFRRLKFSVSAQGDVAVEHGRSSVGRSLEAKVTGTAALPEEITFREPAFDGGALGVECKVRCTVELDAKAERVAFTPLAGEVERAWIEAESAVRSRLLEYLHDAGNVCVYLGAP